MDIYHLALNIYHFALNIQHSTLSIYRLLFTSCFLLFNLASQSRFSLLASHFLLFTFHFSSAQEIPIGTWRTHASYQTAQSVAIAENEVYCASANGLFLLDKTTNSLNTLSKIDGLSETSIVKIAYHQPSKTLVIVYENSNIDLIRENEITEIPLIKNANIVGSKKINHIYIRGDFAYLSADFGVVVLDIIKQEIKETYQNIGANGSDIVIRASTISNDSLVLATDKGVRIGSLSSNLLDFNNWRTVTGLPSENIKSVVSRANQVYALIDNSGLFKYNHTSNWTNIFLPQLTIYNSLNVSNNQIIVSLAGRAFLLNSSDILSSLTSEFIINPQEILTDAGGKFWIADQQNGLVSDSEGNFKAFFPNGVARAETWKLYQYSQSIYGLSGGYNSNYQPLNSSAGFYQFNAPIWTNFNTYDSRFATQIPDIKDFITALYNPLDKNTYFASFGNGILVKKENGTYEIINNTNSPLRTDASGKVKITGLALDSERNLWVANHSLSVGQQPLHVRKADGSWQSFSAINSSALNPLDILVDINGFKWIRLSPNRGGGIWVFDDESNRNRYLSTTSNEGNLPNLNVNAIAQDLEGQIWVGTDRGVVVYFNSAQVFTGSINAVLPIFENRPLLRAEKINAIAIDGGNRKWIGTDNGLWLFNADGSQQVNYFNAANSPLFSDKILDIKINPITGEVFVATDKGILSYRGTATQGTNTQTKVKVFPNPVRPDFNGLVGIEGVVENATIKITDASGRLFYQTQAQGGTATWNVRDYNGKRAKTGIYLIFSTNADGSDVLVSKIAVIE